MHRHSVTIKMRFLTARRPSTSCRGPLPTVHTGDTDCLGSIKQACPWTISSIRLSAPQHPECHLPSLGSQAPTQHPDMPFPLVSAHSAFFRYRLLKAVHSCICHPTAGMTSFTFAPVKTTHNLCQPPTSILSKFAFRSRNVSQYKNVQLSYTKYFFENMDRTFTTVSTWSFQLKKYFLLFPVLKWLRSKL